MTVIGRRSARFFDEDWAASAVGFAGSIEQRLAIALSKRLRSPRLTPNCRRSPSVRSGKTSASIEFSLNAVSYRLRPRLRSQFATSMVALQLVTAKIVEICGHVQCKTQDKPHSVDLTSFPAPSMNERNLREAARLVSK